MEMKVPIFRTVSNDAHELEAVHVGPPSHAKTPPAPHGAQAVQDLHDAVELVLVVQRDPPAADRHRLALAEQHLRGALDEVEYLWK